MTILDTFTFFYGNTPPKVAAAKQNLHQEAPELDIHQVNQLTGWTGLHKAVDQGNIEQIKWLLKHGADVNKPDTLGRTPLHYAAQDGSTSIITLLLKAGADPNIKDTSKFEHTPACRAKDSGHAPEYQAALFQAKQTNSEQNYYAWRAESDAPTKEDFCEHQILNLSWTPNLVWKKPPS